VDENDPFSCVERLHHDLGTIPRADSGRQQREQHPLPTRKPMRPMGLLALLHFDDLFWCATSGWHAPDTLGPLSVVNDVIVAPARAPRVDRFGDRAWRAGRDRHAPQLARREVADRLTVAREKRAASLDLGTR